MSIEKEATNGNYLIKKLFFFGILGIVLLIGLLFIKEIIQERNELSNKTIEEISNEWGEKQKVAGPLLVIPYTYEKIVEKTVVLKDGKEQINKEKINNVSYYIVMPKKLNSKVFIKKEERKRGIYNSMVYVSDININGEFDLEELKKSIEKLNSLEKIYLNYELASVVLGISDIKSLSEVKKNKFNGKDLKLISGVNLPTKNQELKRGFSSEISLNKDVKSIPFNIEFSLKGSDSFTFLPFGEFNKFQVDSNWASPMFFGVLPDTKSIDKAGFSATWNISNLTRNYPQYFEISHLNSYNLSEREVGTSLSPGITHYRQIIRAIKYGALFISLTFLAVFSFDVIRKKETHFIQYLIVGISLALFYLILVSLSEHISFTKAYIVSILAIVLPLSLYIKTIFQSTKYGIIVFLIIIGIYCMLFSILQMEAYALLTGTILIILVLYGVMYATKNLNFISQKNKKEEKEEDTK